MTSAVNCFHNHHQQDTSGSESLMAVRHVGESEIWAAGGGDVGRLWHTTDGGTNWEALTTTVTEAAMITSIAVASDDTLYGEANATTAT